MFKAIKGYEGFYEINELGQIRSVDRVIELRNGGTRKRKGKELKLQKNQYGCATILLSKNGVAKTFQVHRLVANAFVPNPDNLSEVHHINHDKKDNRACNLKWATGAKNLKWTTRAEQKVERWKSAMSKARKKTKLRVVGHGIDKVFISSMEVQRKLGINQSYALQVAKGKHKQAKGYKIYFAEV